MSEAFVDGQWATANNLATFKVYNKATGREIGTVPNMGQVETRHAINAAERAFKTWKNTTGKERQILLTRLYEALVENTEDLAKIIVAENGKPLAEARSELAFSNSFIDWFAAEAVRTYGLHIPSPLSHLRNVVIRQPIGVCGLITPWNFPAAMVTRKLGPALASGCTVVIKAPTETPFSVLAICRLMERVGFPKGVINVITCDKGDTESAVGKELSENAVVRKLSFTGSTRVGKILMNQCSGSLKKLSMELGGNAPFIVFPSADVDKAVEGAIACKFRGSGQTCVCANRIFVHEDIYSDFVAKFAGHVNKFVVGDGMATDTTIGPLVNEAGRDKVARHVDACVEAGAKLLVGGRSGEGLFYEPTVLVDLPEHCPMDDEETFGPLAAIYRFTAEVDLLTKVNAVPVGLAAYLFSRDVQQCWRVAEQLEVGMIGINAAIISQNAIPFGGIKESGFGREGGPTGIQEYMVEKLLTFALE